MKKNIFITILAILITMSFSNAQEVVCPSETIEISLDNPFDEIEEPWITDQGGPRLFLLPADHLANDQEGNPVPVALNIWALLDDEKSDDTPEATITWQVTPSAGNWSTNPKIRDLETITNPAPGTLNNAVMSAGGISTVQIEMSDLNHGQAWAKAGDEFTVTVTATLSTGNTIQDIVGIRIIPGNPVFHVTNPDDGFVPTQMWNLDDTQFRNDYENSRFDFPKKPNGTENLTVYLFDAYRNPIEEDVEVFWSLEGM